MKSQRRETSIEGADWGSAARALFRFCFIYLGLFSLATQVTGSLLPIFSFRGFGPLWPMRDITLWVAANVFSVTPGTNSIDPKIGGETALYWIQAFWIFALAVVAATAWSVLDHKRQNYGALYQGFRVFVRLCLAAQMLEYGITKIIPNQFEAPSLNTLVTPVGDLSLNSLLWTSIGAAPPYQIFTGFAELLAGVLLLIPRTALLGALLCLVDLAQVMSLNMAYDIGLKLTTFHLILLTLFLLAPDLRRLLDVFVFNRATEASREPATSRFAVVAQLLIGVYLVGTFAYINIGFWHAKGGGSPRSALYGIWDVERLSVDGQERPPVLNDYDRRWRRVIFDLPDTMAFQRTDDSLARYGVSLDDVGKKLVLTKGNSTTWKAPFTFERRGADTLILKGEMDGHVIEAQLRLVEFDTLRLLNSDFRWMRD
jgi:uncharacterized membrane protein YphA (DoxX/SURF4 family)